MYGLAERQFSWLLPQGHAHEGRWRARTCCKLLERRLDNVVYRLGFASDHAEARQLVRHGHFVVNGKKVNVPSFLCSANDSVAVKETSRKVTRILENLGAVERRGVPKWLQLGQGQFSRQARHAARARGLDHGHSRAARR